MASKIGFEMSLIIVEFDHCRGNTWTMCEFHESTCNGFGDIWGTDNPIYFSSIDVCIKPALCTTYYTFLL